MTEKTAKKIRWEDLSFGDKAKIFNYWSIVVVISNFFQIFGSIMFILRDITPLHTLELFVGLGCFLAWISISRYIEHAPEYSYFSRTISHAGPNLLRHLINMLPFFIGFGMLGLAIFWQTYRFQNPCIAFFSLFCIMLGDEISNTFQELQQVDFIFGAIYMAVFVFFGMSVLMNIFLVIIGDSFEIIQETHKYNWLTDVNFLELNFNFRSVL